MTDDLIARLEAATEGSRELSDECLLAVGWKDAGKHLGQWVRPDGSRLYKSDAPDPSQNAQDAIDHVVPEGWTGGGRLCGGPRFPMELLGPVKGMALAVGNTPALALCIASLRAHATMKETDDER